MANGGDFDEVRRIVDAVEDPVIPDTDSVKVDAAQLDAARGRG